MYLSIDDKKLDKFFLVPHRFCTVNTFKHTDLINSHTDLIGVAYWKKLRSDTFSTDDFGSDPS